MRVLALVFAILAGPSALPSPFPPFPPPLAGDGSAGGGAGGGWEGGTSSADAVVRHDFPGDRPSIFAISSSRLSGGGSAFAFPGKTLRSGGGDEGGSGNRTLAFDALMASRRALRSGGDSGRMDERAAAGGAAGGSIGFGGRRNAASRRWAISARLFSSD